MIKLPAIFSSHMVLQREKNILVWGESDSAEVTVSISDISRSVEVMDGKWELQIPPMQAGGPYTMTITDGSDNITYEDIMLGEVWLAGGQSNMELELQNSKDGKEVVKNADDDKVRYYYTPKVRWVGEELYKEEENSSWELCNSDTCGRWSAVGYYYAKELAAKLGVTVGIIGCNWGGTSASCWTSREFLEREAELTSYIEEYDAAVAKQSPEDYVKAWDAYTVYQAEFDKNVGHYYETAENPTWDEAISLYGENQYPGPMGPRNETRPYGLYESMLSRVMPYTLAGFIYYQGEEDDHKPYTYYTLLSTLVRQWRHDWRDDELPFICVQLPMFRNGDAEPDYKNWPLIREAQMKLFKTVKNTGIAVILDKGEFANIHPTEKDSVGKRLCNQALCNVYGMMDEKDAFGPIYDTYVVDGDKMNITFAHAEDGIVLKGDKAIGFEMAGLDKKFYPAEAVVNGSKVVVTCDKVGRPVYARYCWTNYCDVTLFGHNGMPVAPFRTSDMDGAVATGSRNGWVD